MTTAAILAAKYLLVLPVLIVALYFLRQPRTAWPKMIVFAVPSLLLTYVLGLLGNHLYVDPRPFVVGHFAPPLPHAPDNGFPSDHTLLLAGLAAVASYWNRRLGIVLWIFAAAVAAARVAIGLHHPIDVIGSAVIAVVAAAATYGYLRYVRRTEVI